MAKKKSIYQGARDIWEQAIGSVKKLSRFLSSESHDKRTIRSTQKAWSDLTKGRTNKEVGEQLGIPYQRVTVIKRKVAAGEAYGPELRDIAKEAAEEYNESPRKLEGGIYFFPNREKLAKSVNHIDTIKTFPELQDAINFWKKVIKSDQHIVISQTGKGDNAFYQVLGLGTRRQRPFQGKIADTRAKNRIGDLLKKYPR